MAAPTGRVVNYKPIVKSLNIFRLMSSAASQAPMRDHSIREIKRKRARAHYKKKHNKDIEPEDDLKCSPYYFENGFRKIYPYMYNFSTFVKGRWLGKKLIDIYESEFMAQDREKHEKEILCGNILVNGKIVSPDHIVSNNQLIVHRVHRHEHPVLDTPIEILVDTDDILVVDKPASIPCHPCGRYRYNSITYILQTQYGYTDLRTLYRLDRPTSGLLILPKSTQLSKKLEKQLATHKLQKEYVCRVVGEFPEEEVRCDEPIGLLCRRLSVYTTDPQGKPSSTTFTRLSYNGKTSVVKCVPHTGRTHQIRVHLQHLGYPICNDVFYNSTAYGPQKGKGGLKENTVEQIEQKLMASSNPFGTSLGPNPGYVANFGADGLKPCESDTMPITCLPTCADTCSTSARVEDNVTDDEKDKQTANNVADDRQCKTSGNIEETVCNKYDEAKSDLKTVKETLKEANDETDSPLRKKQKLNESQSGNDSSDDKSDTHDKGENLCKEDKDSTCGSIQATEVGSSESTDVDAAVTPKIWQSPVEKPPLDSSRLTVNRNCFICKELSTEPDAKEMIIYLHAVRYKGPDWEYSTKLPYWAESDFTDEHILEDTCPAVQTVKPTGSVAELTSD